MLRRLQGRNRMPTPTVHNKGNRAKILLSSVFGPYAQNDEYGSRAINPMELYQNQVTRTQGGFSLRMFHRSFGLMMLQENIDAPCTLLDFPSLERFALEIQNNSYDIVGISAIMTNIVKVYTPVPGTPLFEQHRKKGTLLPDSEISAADAHGQYRFNYRHRYIHDGREEKYLLDAFEQDFEKNAAAIAFENEPRQHPKIRMLRKRWVAGELYPQPASYPIRRQSWK